MPKMSPREQRQHLASLLFDISNQRGDWVANAVRTEAVRLSVENATLLLDLVRSGADGVDAESVLDLDGLGYRDASQVLAVSRLVESSGHQKTVPSIVSLGLSRDRAEALLRITPPELRLLTAADDKPWRRAMTGLEEEALGECIASSPLSRATLWMSVVSAQDEHMAKRIGEFTRAGHPYVPWIASGHSLESLESVVPLNGGARHLTRLEIHGAVRRLDRGEYAGMPHDEGQEDSGT